MSGAGESFSLTSGLPPGSLATTLDHLMGPVLVDRLRPSDTPPDSPMEVA